MAQQTVHLFVFDTLADWEPGYAIAGINNPAFQAMPGRFRVLTVADSGKRVKTIGGVTIVPDMTLEQLDPAQSAMLILPGGELWDQNGNVSAAEKAREFLDAGVPVAAICGATFGLARAGLLDKRAHTSNAPEYLQASGYDGSALYQNEPAVTANNLITAGSTSPLEFAQHIFRMLSVYDEDVLEAWYGLFKTGDPRYFAALAQHAGAAG
jgi:putative intracellular protease/amidase